MLNLDTHILVFALSGTLTSAEKKVLSSDKWGISDIVVVKYNPCPVPSSGDDRGVTKEKSRMSMRLLAALALNFFVFGSTLAETATVADATKPAAGTNTAEKQPASTRATRDANTVVAAAIKRYSDKLAAIDGGKSATDLQTRKAWLDATKELDETLRKSRVTITYSVQDVSITPGEQFADIKVTDVAIKSSDPDIPDVTFSRFYNLRVISSEKEAAKITKESKISLEGNLAYGVSLARPAAEQPATYEDDWKMTGYRPVGIVHDLSVLFSSTPMLMIQNNCALKIDGVARKLK